MVEAIGHPAIAVAVDVYHVWWDLTLGQELKRLGGQKIAGYHLCDWLADTTDVLLDRGMMGDGVADLKHLRAAVEDAGYRGFCEVEIFSKDNWWKRDPARSSTFASSAFAGCVETGHAWRRSGHDHEVLPGPAVGRQRQVRQHQHGARMKRPLHPLDEAAIGLDPRQGLGIGLQRTVRIGAMGERHPADAGAAVRTSQT